MPLHHLVLEEFAIFLLMILTLMSFVIGIATLGYGMVILIGMAAFAVLTPLFVPLMFIRKMRREVA